jgi:hypothetical protein
MKEYMINWDVLELPRGALFMTLPIPVGRGDLALFDLEGWLIPGRWYPGTGEPDSIRLPGLRIEIGESLRWKIIGRVVPVDVKIESITTLLESEYGRFLENSFPRFLDS